MGGQPHCTELETSAILGQPSVLRDTQEDRLKGEIEGDGRGASKRSGFEGRVHKIRRSDQQPEAAMLLSMGGLVLGQELERTEVLE